MWLSKRQSLSLPNKKNRSVFSTKAHCESRELQHSPDFKCPGMPGYSLQKKDLLLPAGKPKKGGTPNIVFYIVCGTDIKYSHDTQATPNTRINVPIYNWIVYFYLHAALT